MRRVPAFALALLLLSAACGGGGAGSDNAPNSVDLSRASDIPEVVVRDTAGGEFDLATLIPAEKPILIWFWAPY